MIPQYTAASIVSQNKTNYELFRKTTGSLNSNGTINDSNPYVRRVREWFPGVGWSIVGNMNKYYGSNYPDGKETFLLDYSILHFGAKV